MKQRVIAMLMVSILALSMPVQVFAAKTTKINALYLEPEIKVEVHAPNAAGELVINPHGLPVNVEGKVESAQIVSTPWSIENRSNIAISVDAKVSAQVAADSTMELYYKSVASNRSRNKLVFMFLDMRVTDPDVNLTDLDWADTIFNRRVHLPITKDSHEREKVMTLVAANEDGTTANGGVGAFHIDGNAVKNPENAWDPTKDKVTISVVLTFRPTVPKV